MAVNKKLTDASGQWMQDKASAMISVLFQKRREAQAEFEDAQQRAKLKVTTTITTDFAELKEPPAVPLPKERLAQPTSPLLPRAYYLRDPYYQYRLNKTNPRRRKLESQLEGSTFLRPNGGELRVLCVVAAQLGREAPRDVKLCVVRDWVGAYCLMVLEPSTDRSDFVVAEAVPILEHVEFPPGFSKLPIQIDDYELVATFHDQEYATTLHDSLKLAMCSMYGVGSDDRRITCLRAYATEFAHDSSPAQAHANVDVNSLLKTILTEDKREPENMQGEFVQLRRCMWTPAGRDHVLRQWIRSIDEGFIFKRKSQATIKNHLRVIEEAMKSPAYHEDPSLYESVITHLSVLCADQPKTVEAEVNGLKAIVRLVDPVLDTWQSRHESADVPFEACFLPEPGSEADRQEREITTRRREQAHYMPGIYLTMLCYCGSQVLCNASETPFSECIIPQPTAKELSELTPENRDFRWILQLGGSNDNWAAELSQWSDLYSNVGRSTFRAQFLRAANRLMHSQPFRTLGFILDTPIVHSLVHCAHIITVLRVDTKEKVPANAGRWRNMTELEQELYSRSLVVRPSSRLPFLPSTYREPQRFVQTAVKFRDQIQSRIPPGFYLGLLVLHNDSQGPMALVPESNRTLPPLSLVCEESPTLDQWRWMQSLNERYSRTRTLGIAQIPDLKNVVSVTFEQRFARSLRELEVATGVKVTQFYDQELFILDEGQQIRVFFAVHFVHAQHTAELVPTAPSGGAVPMVFKHVDVLEETLMRLYWPRIYPTLAEERQSYFRKAYSTAQPFAVDEAYRLRHESAVYSFCEIDKYLLLVSCLRQLTLWMLTDGRSVVASFGGDPEASVVRSIEDTVEVAVSNQAATQDINILTMKSLLFESSAKPHYSWATLISQLREIDRVMVAGYSNREVSIPQLQQRQFKLRTHDEMFAGEIDEDENPRPPTIYDVPCTLSELVFKDVDPEMSVKYFGVQDTIKYIVDLACVQCVDVGNIVTIGQVVSDMISVVEASNDLVDGAALLSLKMDTEEQALKEREKFQRHWLDVYHDSHEEKAIRGLAAAVESQDEEEMLAPAIFYDGSPHAITSAADGVRVCIAKAANSCYQLQQLVRTTNSTVEALELIQSLQTFTACVNKRNSLLGLDQGPSRSGQEADISRSAQSAPSAGRSSVTMVSKEFEEFNLPPVDPLRCLVLRGASGKVRFPTIPSASMDVLSHHLRCSDLAIPQALLALPTSPKASEQLLEMAIQMKAPVLALRLVTIIFASTTPSGSFFTASSALQVKSLLDQSFMFEYGIKDWLHIEVLGGAPIAAAMDVMWWTRYLSEATAETQTSKREDAFTDHEGSWKQVYAETRVRVFLSFGVHALSREEVALWGQTLGRYVEYISLKDANIGDAEIEVLTSCCQNIKSLDLSYTKITHHSIELIARNLRQIAECSVAGCDLTPTDQDALRRHCTENRRRNGSS